MAEAEPLPENVDVSAPAHGPSVARQRRTRQLVAAGATLAVVGIGLSLGSGNELAGAVFLPGMAILLLGLHRLGRHGPA